MQRERNERVLFPCLLLEKLADIMKMQQQIYIERLKRIHQNCTYQEFCSACARLTWVQHPRPERAPRQNFLS